MFLTKMYIGPEGKILFRFFAVITFIFILDKLFETSALGRKFYNRKRKVPVFFMPFRYKGLCSISICEREWQNVE